MASTKLRKSPSGPTFDGNAVGDVVTWNGTDWVPLPVPAPPGNDEKVKVSATDTTANYLDTKVVSQNPTYLSVAVLGSGGDEQLELTPAVPLIKGLIVVDLDPVAPGAIAPGEVGAFIGTGPGVLPVGESIFALMVTNGAGGGLVLTNLESVGGIGVVDVRAELLNPTAAPIDSTGTSVQVVCLRG